MSQPAAGSPPAWGPDDVYLTARNYVRGLPPPEVVMIRLGPKAPREFLRAVAELVDQMSSSEGESGTEDRHQVEHAQGDHPG